MSAAFAITLALLAWGVIDMLSDIERKREAEERRLKHEDALRRQGLLR